MIKFKKKNNKKRELYDVISSFCFRLFTAIPTKINNDIILLYIL